ncbi:cytochrome P450 [Rickenella mellea]|uniref:Cytochrome P450 n=1 Tax=Rickenella mellea TaxID=50990 RepID=A0A4Y7Q6C2_9AGAM|nr:cytochrome P450 [Rickenella mellea]
MPKYLEHNAVYIFIAVGIFFLYLRKRSQHAHPLPPGPPGLPIIGNLRDMPAKSEWLTFQNWAKRYGDIIHVSMFGQSIIIINSYEMAFDLFERRSYNYSDRPSNVMVGDLVGYSFHFGFMRYGEWWRQHRRALHQNFQLGAIHEYRPLQTEATHDLLRRLLKAPDDFMAHVRYSAGALILRVAYGIKVASENDPSIHTAEEALKAMAATGNAGAYLVDTIPFLKYLPEWFPGAKFKREAKEWRRHVLSMRDSPFAVVKKTMESGILNLGYTPSRLHKLEGDPSRQEKEEIIKNTAGALYAVGRSHYQTVATINTFILAMTLYPDIQRRAQETIDKLVGSERLPDFLDRPHLPYIEAIVKEALRWQLVLPLAVPHAAVNEDLYKGYRIPAGSIVIGNAWSMLQNEQIYRNASEFNPDRFMKNEQLNPDIPHPLAAFGFGRRICPGRHFAEASVWIAIVSILSVYNISKALDDSGREITPPVEYTTGMLSYPVPFKCMITPRSVGAESLIRGTMSDMQMA